MVYRDRVRFQNISISSSGCKEFGFEDCLSVFHQMNINQFCHLFGAPFR